MAAGAFAGIAVWYRANQLGEAIANTLAGALRHVSYRSSQGAALRHLDAHGAPLTRP